MGKILGRGVTWSDLHFRKTILITDLGDLEIILWAGSRETAINRYHREEEGLNGRKSSNFAEYPSCLWIVLLGHMLWHSPMEQP